MLARGQLLSSSKNNLDCVLIYPDKFSVGIANLGWQHIVWHSQDYINWRVVFQDEELFLYEEKLEYSIFEADIIFIALPFESTFLNVIKFIRENKLKDNKEAPILIGGGMTSINPYPLVNYLDLCIIGNGVNVVREITQAFIKKAQKEANLLSLAKIKGVIYLKYIRNQQHFALKNDNTKLIYSHWTSGKSCYDYDKYFSIMVALGCKGACPYCVVGNTQGNRGKSITFCSKKLEATVRECIMLHSPEVVKLFFASGEPTVEDTLRSLYASGINGRVGSLNCLQINDSLLDILKKSGQTEVTFAPETIHRLRKSINKSYMTDSLILSKAKAISNYKFNITLYFLGGLIGEAKSDLKKYIEFFKVISDSTNGTNINIHYNPIFPKAQTFMQHFKMLNIDIMRNNLYEIRKQMSGYRNISFTSIIDDPLAFYQPFLSLGDERVGLALDLLVGRDDPSEHDWRRAFQEVGIKKTDFISEGYNDRDIRINLPFQNISFGAYL